MSHTWQKGHCYRLREVTLAYPGGPSLISWARTDRNILQEEEGCSIRRRQRPGAVSVPTFLLVPGSGGRARTRQTLLGAEGSPPADSQQGNRPTSSTCQELYSCWQSDQAWKQFSQIPQQGTQPCQHLVPAWWGQSHTSSLQNCGIIIHVVSKTVSSGNLLLRPLETYISIIQW